MGPTVAQAETPWVALFAILVLMGWSTAPSFATVRRVEPAALEEVAGWKAAMVATVATVLVALCLIREEWGLRIALFRQAERSAELAQPMAPGLCLAEKGPWVERLAVTSRRLRAAWF